MAIQAQMYPENLGLPLISGSQDWLLITNNNIHNNFNNNNNMGFNGCAFSDFSCFNNLQQQKQLQFQQQQQVILQIQQQRNSYCENNNNDGGLVLLSSSKNNCTSTTTIATTGIDYQMSFHPSFIDQLEKQRQEIDRFITMQNESLKLALQEQRKHQISTIMRKLETKAMELLNQKVDEIARATKRTMELEDIIKKLDIENQEWQRLVAENEAMITSLNITLDRLKEHACCSSSSKGVEDSESCCNVNNNVVVNSNRATRDALCKVCKTGKSCMLLLPCRHLCCCKGCEPFVDVCPLCKDTKVASIEALIS